MKKKKKLGGLFCDEALFEEKQSINRLGEKPPEKKRNQILEKRKKKKKKKTYSPSWAGKKRGERRGGEKGGIG